ncbi:MAG: exodeoxyribonuclease VII small subunit [Gemmatimonadota bacterium]
MNDPNPSAATFERLLSDLEGVVDRLGAEDLELDEALSLFERGVVCLREAGRLLDAAEGRVEELIETASGDLEAIGFEPPAREEAGGANGQ